MEIVRRTCIDCKVAKADTEFNWRNKAKKWRHSVCRECGKIRQKRFRETHPKYSTHYRLAHLEASREAQRRRKKTEKTRLYCREYRKRRPDIHRNEDLKSAYGITLEQFNAMVAGQGNKCLVCGACGELERFQKLQVDHDHATGKIRGLLCDKCNRGLGFFRDNTALLQNAIGYLNRA